MSESSDDYSKILDISSETAVHLGDDVIEKLKIILKEHNCQEKDSSQSKIDFKDDFSIVEKLRNELKSKDEKIERLEEMSPNQRNIYWVEQYIENIKQSNKEMLEEINLIHEECFSFIEKNFTKNIFTDSSE